MVRGCILSRRLEAKQICLLLFILEALASSIKQEKEIENIKNGKELTALIDICKFLSPYHKVTNV